MSEAPGTHLMFFLIPSNSALYAHDYSSFRRFVTGIVPLLFTLSLVRGARVGVSIEKCLALALMFLISSSNFALEQKQIRSIQLSQYKLDKIAGWNSDYKEPNLQSYARLDAAGADRTDRGFANNSLEEFISFCAQLSAPTQEGVDVRTLVVGRLIERQFEGGRPQAYIVELRQGQVLQIDLYEHGVNVRLGVGKLSDTKLTAQSNFGSGYDRETVSLITEQAGRYSVVVVPTEAHSNAGYEITAQIRVII